MVRHMKRRGTVLRVVFVPALDGGHPEGIVHNFKDHTVISNSKSIFGRNCKWLGELQRVRLQGIVFNFFNNADLEAVT